MTKRLSRLRLFALLLTLLAVLCGYAWQSAHRLLEQQGISHLDWQGVGLSWSGVQIERIELEQRSLAGTVRLDARQLALGWRDAASYLDVQRLDVQWQASDTPAPATPSTLNPTTLFDPLGGLPHNTRIEHLNAELPCASGRCRLEGSLTLRHAGAQLFPVSLEVAVHRGERQALLRVEARGNPQAVQLETRLFLDQQPRLTLLSSLESSETETLWSGELAVPSLPGAPWPLDWLTEWLVLPGQSPAVSPVDLQVTGDWRLQLPPGPVQLDQLTQAQGYLNLAIHVPEPLPLAAAGHLQGDLAVKLVGQQGQWFARQLQADLRLDQLQGDWLEKLPEDLRPSALIVRIQPRVAEPNADMPSNSLPLQVDVRSEGPTVLSVQADVTATSTPPWAVQIHQASIDGRIAKLRWTDWSFANLKTQLQVSGQLDSNGLSLSLAKDSQLRAGQVSSSQLAAQQVRADLTGLALTSRFADGSLQALSVQGPTDVQVKGLSHAQLKTQNWTWQGKLDADLMHTQIQGNLTGDGGLALSLLIDKTDQGPLSIKAQSQEIFLRAGNPLANSFTAWPALLSLSQGRLRANLQLSLPPGDSPPQLDLNLNLQGMSGIYDRTELTGLDAQLQLLLNGNRLILHMPDLQLAQANPGIGIGPLQLHGSYSAALEQPMGGELDLRRAQAGFLGGQLSLEPAKLNLNQGDLPLLITVRGLELAELFRAYPTEGLAGQGTLDGQLPIHIAATGVSIRQGHLAARAPGALRFHSERIRALGRANPAMKLVADALEDFQYQRLSSEVSYDEQGQLLLALRLEGQNPAIEHGRPIHFSINLEEDIPSLLTSLQLSDKVNERIQQRVQERLRQKNMP